MAWTYLAASAVYRLPCTTGSQPSPIVSETPTLKLCCCRECILATSTELLSGMTLHRSTGPCFLVSTSFSAASRAKTSALPELAQAWTDSEAAFIGTCIDLLLKSSRRLYSLRTSRRLEPVVLSEWSGHLPSSGMTVGGQLFQPPKLAPATFASDGSYLPTPTACDYGKNNGRNSKDPTKSRDRWSLTVRARRGELPGHPSGRLNPEWIEQAMGFRISWTEIDASVMPWYLNKRKRRSCA